jgi:hypothetical protein
MLTDRQIQILRWLDDNPSDQARWLVNGKDPKGEHPSAWTHMEVSGPTGSILIASADNKALQGMLVGCPSRDKIYGITPEAKASLTTGKGE